MAWENAKLFAKNIAGFFIAKPFFLYLILALAALIAIYLLFSDAGGCSWQSKVEKKKAEVNSLTNEAQNINANLTKLDVANQLKQTEVNVLNGNRDAAVNETDKALENAERIRNKNYNGTTGEDLERKSKEAYR